MTDNRTADPDFIEDDIRRTQDRIGDTIDKLEEQLSPPRLAKSLLGDDNSDIAREALEITRQNPIPVALIAIGVIWLVATARTRNGSRLADLLGPRAGTDGATGRHQAAGATASSYRDAAPAPRTPQEPVSAWRPIGTAASETHRSDLLGPDERGDAYSGSLRPDDRAIPL